MSEFLREKAFTYKVETPALAPAVLLADFKKYAKIVSAAEDTTLQTILTSAIQFGESYTGRTFVETEFKTYRDEFIGRSNYIELLKSPFQAISANGFQYYDESETLVDVNAATYMLTDEDVYSRIALFDGDDWPSDVSTKRPYQSIVITFKAGYGVDDTFVPDELKNAIMAHALNAVRNRGDCDKCTCDAVNLPPVAKTLYQPFRILDIRLGF